MSDEKKTDDGTAAAGEDLQRLAKDYVDLWEQQIKAFSSDEALARTMAQTLELMNAGAANVAAMMQKAAYDAADASTDRGDGDDAGDGQGNGADDAGAASAGTASGGAEPDLRQLVQRIAELEERLSRLEGLTEPAGKIARGKTAKR